MNWEAASDIALRLTAVAVLVFLNGFFVAAEFALVKVRDTQLAPLARAGHRRARMGRFVLSHLDATLSAAQLGITLASLALGWIGEPVFVRLLAPILDWLRVSEDWRHTIAVVVGFSTITFLHITAGEQAPKWMAIQKPLPTAMWVAYPMYWFSKVSYPFVWVLNRSSQLMLRQMGVEPAREREGLHSEEELRLLFASAHERSGGTDLGRDVVLNALDLRRRVARDVMRPRQQIERLDTGAGIEECLALAERTRYSRFPLCEGNNIDRTIGVVHFKDLYALREKAVKGADLRTIARKLVYVPETARLETLLKLLLERKVHMAIVVDEYGGTVGMVTLENILEELVGPIQDEFDQEMPLAVRQEDGSWMLDGVLPLHELSELVGERLHEEGITTTSGFVTHRLGGFPRTGDILRLSNAWLRVEKMDGPRVATLKLVVVPRDETTMMRKE